MTLTLRALSLNDHPLTRPITAHFDVQGGSVGRADHNTLALPDPERHISRQQAEISAIGGAYRIKNVGSANPIIVRGQPLARGETVPLSHLDQVRIGGYLLEVIEEAATAGEASTVVRGRVAVEAGGPGLNSGSMPAMTPGSRSSPLSRSNPFANLLDDATPTPALSPYRPGATPSAPREPDSPPTPPPPPPPPLNDPFFNPRPAAAGVPAESAAWEAARPDPPRALLPDDFDPFAAPAPDEPPLPRPDSSPGAGLFDDLIPSTAPASVDQLFNLQPGQIGQRDPLADFMADISPMPRAAGSEPRPGQDPERRAEPLSTDPMALFGNPSDAYPASDPRPAPEPDAQELHGAFVPPMPSRLAPVAAPAEPAPPVSSTPPASPAQNHTDWHGDPHELWSAFCEGAGICIEPPQGLHPELMRVVGSLLQAAVAGTLQLMVVRATAKHELRAQVTMIQARNNNPLKFSPDARSALEQMLQPPMRGFLAAPEAMTDAMHDLMGHTIGTMAGTRAALEGVLDRFTPQQLEAKLVGKSMLDNLLPMNRKAKLWELYLHHYETLRNEAQDDFHTLFGRAFLAAYEQQLDRLQRSKTDEASEPGHA